MAKGRRTLQLLVALAALTATSAAAQVTPVAVEEAGSLDGWARVEDGSDSGEHTLGITAEPLPKITITASRDTIYGGLEDMRFVLKRDKVGEELTVKLWLHQDEDWLSRRTQTRYVYFYPWEDTAVLRVHRSKFSADVTEWGCIIAKVIEVDGKDYSKRKVRAGVWVISQSEPLITLFVGRDVFTEAEGAGQLTGTHLVAVMADGLPRGVSLWAAIGTRGNGSRPGLTATPGEDYDPDIRAARIEESDFVLYDDTWVGGADFVVPILDDNLREGDETFEFILEPDPELAGLVHYTRFSDWSECGSGCAHRVNIVDDDDMPPMALSVSADEIMEEGETSSTAMVSITNGVRFEDDKLLTLALGGTATMGADYSVSPADADQGMADHQVVLPAGAASAEVTLTAMSDEVDDPGEKIEVSAALDGDAIGDMKAVRIMNREMPKPVITLSASRDEIIAGIDDLELMLTREGPLDQALTVTVQLAQDQRWIPFSSCPVTFAAGSATATATLRHSQFSARVSESGNLTASVGEVDGYDAQHASATVFVFSQQGPGLSVSFGSDSYTFEETAGDVFVDLVVRAAAGSSRGASVRFSVVSRNGGAEASEDFEPLSEIAYVSEDDFVFDHGSWLAEYRVPLKLLDDDVHEGAESFELLLERAPDHPAGLQLGAGTSVEITDDEDRAPPPELGPTVEVTFNGLGVTQDPYAVGAATGPFMARFTFSEPVSGFTQDKIRWQTHAETTVDGTPIGVLLWDFTELERGVDYTVMVMPSQNGRLWLGVKQGQVHSVATGAGNHFGSESVRVDFPKNQLLVAPPGLTVDEGSVEHVKFWVVLTSEPTDDVEAKVSGMEGTQLKLDRSELNFVRKYWNSPRAVRVRAGSDANSADETITLQVGAWYGGYEGRSAKVVVTVRDAGASSGDRAGDGDGEAADIFLLEDVTPEVATAALFGDLELDQEKLDALDRLGNRNGGYDLGDLLSWIERCRRGAGICGGPLSSSSQSIPAAAAALAGFGAARRNGGRRQDSGGRNPARRKARRRLDGGIRRRARTAWFGLALLFAAATTWGCADSVVEPPHEREPGNLTVWLTGPAGVRDSGAMLVLSGPGIESVWAPDLELFESGASASRQIIISGAVASGPVLEFQVPDRMLSGQYRVQLLEVAGEDYFLRDLSDYSVDIRR